MKIRQGFVSNSSSSSFICIVRKDSLDTLLEGKSCFHRKVAKRTGNEQKFGKDTVVMFEHMSGEQGYSFTNEFGFIQEDLPKEFLEEDNWDTGDTEEIVWDAWNDVMQDIEKLSVSERIIIRQHF